MTEDLPLLDEAGEPLLKSEHPTVDAADPAVAKRRKTEVSLESREAIAFWVGVLSDPIGRREMWRMFDAAGVFKAVFQTGPNGFPQPEATWFAAGQKAFGESLYLNLSRIDRPHILEMHAEHDDRFSFPELPKKKLSS